MSSKHATRIQAQQKSFFLCIDQKCNYTEGMQIILLSYTQCFICQLSPKDMASPGTKFILLVFAPCFILYGTLSLVKTWYPLKEM